MFRPLLGRVARPVLREIRRFRNRHKIAPGPVALPRERREERKQKVLLLAWYDPEGLQTIRDNVARIGWYSAYRWDLMNLFGHESGRGLVLPRTVRLDDYDAVFVHCTASYDSENLERLIPVLAVWRGLKIMMKQDEHFRTRRIVDYVRDGGFEMLLTCIAPEEVRKVYPEGDLPRTRLFHALTGYITDDMRALSYPFEGRPLDIGYRGSPQPFCFGKLAYEKREIAEVFERVCRERGLAHDIKFGLGDRFFGTEWFDFLGRCKGTVGVESGASVFDFDGSVERETKAFLKKKPNAPFEEVSRLFLQAHEGNVHYNQVSPRHFEAAACGTAQILYEGRYSGIFEPWKHYFPLKRDLSNLDEVLRRFLDPVERKRVMDAARADVVMNDAYHYRGFVQRLDAAIESAFREKGIA